MAKKKKAARRTRKKVYKTKALARANQKKGLSIRKVKDGYVLYRRK